MIRLAVVFLLAGSLPAVTQTAEEQARLIAAIEAAGCVITEENNMAILRAADMTEDQGRNVVMALFAGGKASPQGDDLKLTAGKCE